MKKLFVFILIVLLLCGINLLPISNLTLDKIFPSASVEVYLADNEYNGELLTHKNGDGQIIFCDVENLLYILNNYVVNGYTLRICASDMNSVLQKFMPNYYFESSNYVYGYKQGIFNKCINVNDEKVNFQCVKSNNDVLIGFPILLGSY